MKFAAGRADAQRRTQLTRERVLAAAIGFADRDGIEAISMRRLAQDLGVEAMSLYTHVRNKDDLLDGMVDALVGQIPLGVRDGDWKTSIRAMAFDARGVFKRHPWAPRIVQTRSAPGPAMLGYLNTVIGTFREGGFSIAQAHHALHLFGSRLLGFTQDLFDDSAELDPEAAASVAQEMRTAFPYVAEMAVAVTHDGALGPCDDDAEFTLTLDLMLDALDRLQHD
jgi:AcrR family transcriptional regulator